MKKLFLSFLVILSMLLLAGCFNAETSEQTTSQTTTSQTTTESTTTSQTTTNQTTTESTTVDENSYIDDFGNKFVLDLANASGDYIYTEGKSLVEAKQIVASLMLIEANDANGIYQDSYPKGAKELFNINNKVKLQINISEEELKKIEEDNPYANAPTKDIYRKCSLDISYMGLTFHMEEVGIRMKGNSSRGPIFSGEKLILRHYKLSFGETFDDAKEYGEDVKEWASKEERDARKDRNLFGLEKLDLRFNKNEEKTYLREYYAFESYRSQGLLAPHSNPMNLWMNIDGTKYNAGVYLGVETVDKVFLAHNLVKSYSKGDLYKCGWGSGAGASLNDIDDNLFGVEDASIGKFYTYDLKTNKKTCTHENIKNFITNLKNTTDIEDFIANNLYEEEFFKYLAVSYFLGDPDDFRGNYNNYYIYFVSETNKAIFIPTDNDRVLASMDGNGSNPTGSAGTQVGPYDNKSGYGGVTNQNLLVKTIFNKANAYSVSKYNEALAQAKDILCVSKFSDLFNVAKNNYNDVVLVNSIFVNESPAFSLNEATNINGGDTISISIYMEEKLKTYNNSINMVSSATVYFAGSINGWSSSDSSYCFTNSEGDVYHFEVSLNANDEFKIVIDGNWYGYDNIVSGAALATSNSENKNIKITNTGNYEIIVNASNAEITINVK